MILGLCGQAGAGKDTLAREIIKVAPWVTILHFADKLKENTTEVFGISSELLHDPAKKEEPLYEPIEMDDFVGTMSTKLSLPIQPQYKIAYTPRQLLQYFGTEYVRSVADSYWIEATLSRCFGKDAVIADVRFPNEAEAIRNEGGVVVRVVRDGRTVLPTHASENVDGLSDIVVPNTSGEFDGLRCWARALVRLHFGEPANAEATL